jgi:hypothetical protein
MTLVHEIAEKAAAGLSAEAIAIEISVARGVELSAEWVRRVMGADGFAHVVAQVQPTSPAPLEE